MLVSTHKLILLLIMLMLVTSPGHAQGQEWSLEQCIDTAFVHNKNLMMAKNQTELAHQKREETKAQLLPKLFFQGDYRYYTDLPYQLMPQSAFGGEEGIFREVQFGVPHNIGAHLTFKMPLYDPQIMGSIKATETLQELSHLQETKTREQIYLEISNLYYNAQILKNKLEFIRKNLANSQQLEKNTQILFEQTLAQRTDLDKVILQSQQLQTSEIQVSSQYITVLQSLKFAMGLPLDAELEVPATINSREEKTWTEKSTIDMQIQESRYKLAQQELNTLQLSKLPSLSLYGNYGTTGFGYTGSPDSFLNFYRVSFAGVQVSYPLFNGTITRKKIRQKKTELTNSQLQRDLVAEQAQLQTQTAILQQRTAKHQLLTSQSQIKLAESVYQRTLMQQMEGIASLTDVLLADNALRESQQQYLNAMVDYLKATLEIKKTSGNLLN